MPLRVVSPYILISLGLLLSFGKPATLCRVISLHPGRGFSAQFFVTKLLLLAICLFLLNTLRKRTLQYHAVC